MKSKKNNNNNLTINGTLIISLLNKEKSYINSLNDVKFKKLQEKVNSIKAPDNEDLLITLIKELNNSDNYVPTNDELKKIGKIFNPNINTINKCLSQYDKIEEVKTNFGENNYIVTKNNKKFFVKIKSLQYLSKKRFENLIESFEISKKASKLGLTIKLHDIFICKDKDGKNKIFILSEYVDGISLKDYLDDNKLTDKDKEKILNLINKCFENNIILKWINNKNILIKKNKEFILTTLSNASTTDSIIVNKKKDILEDLDWITSKSDNMIEELSIKKLIREKKINFK